MKIAIVTRPHYASPRILSACLKEMLHQNGCDATVYFKINVFKRLLGYSFVKNRYNPFVWYSYKWMNWISDWLFLRKLKTYDAIVVTETIPYAFLKYRYDFNKARTRLGGIPLLLYEVYFLGNAPTMIEYLEKNNHNSINTFDWHLAVSEVTEIRNKPTEPWSQIGLHLKSTGLKPMAKERLFAVVDFERTGNEKIRQAQIQALEDLNIPYVALAGKYSIEEIREYYKKATFYFIQFGESFGVPIAECLSCGCYVFTPDSSWAMAWRLNENPQIHGPGKLADCFVVYNDNNDLKRRLEEFKHSYDLQNTPQKVFDQFHRYYPSYYDGNTEGLQEVLNKIRLKKIGSTY